MCLLRAHRPLSRRLLCRFPLVILKQAPQSLSTSHCSLFPSCLRLRSKQDPVAFALMVALLMVQVDNTTPIILNRERSVTFGTLGTLALWWFTKLSPGMGELCADAVSMRTQGLGSWRSRNGCSIRRPAAVCARRQCPWSAAVLCWI